MLINTLTFVNSLIFLLLSLIHAYWAFGGVWAMESTIPEQFKEAHFSIENKLKVTIATIIVAIGLMMFCIIIASNYSDLEPIIKDSWTIILTGAVGVIFLLRAIGDFNYFGIFKKKSDSKFAKSDTRIFMYLSGN